MLNSNDGWAVGDSGTIIHWEGVSWSIVDVPSVANIKLASVFIVNANDGWIVGEHGVILHWDGVSWKAVSSLLGISPQVGLNSVFMVNSNDGWAVGWEKTPSPFETRMKGVILRWDGASWSKVTLLTTDNLERFNSVFMVNSKDGWAVGYRSDSCIVHWDGKSWRKVSGYRYETLFSVFMVGANDRWVVGGDFWRPTILHCYKGPWKIVSSPVDRKSFYCFSVFMVNSNDGWIVGGEGTILHWNGESLSVASSPTKNSLHSIFMVNANDGWIVGGSGMILRYTKEHIHISRTPLPTPTITTPRLASIATPPVGTTDSTTMALISLALLVIIIGSVGAFLFRKRRMSKDRTKTKVPAQPPEQEIKPSLVLEYDKLNTELKAAKQKLTKLNDSHARGIVSKDAYDALKNGYEKKISQLEKSIDEIWPLKHPLASEYENLSTELETIRQKITKLTDSYAGGIVSEEGYKTLMADYEERSSKVKRAIDEVEARIEGELSVLQEEELKATKELELLTARQIVGDVSETEYTAGKSSLDSRLTEIRRKRSSLTYPLDSQDREAPSSKPVSKTKVKSIRKRK